MFRFNEIKKSFLVSLWMMLLTFPIMVIRVNTIDNIIEWRWKRMFMVGVGTFFLSFLWRYLHSRKEAGQKRVETGESETLPLAQRLIKDRRLSVPAAITLAVFIIAFPFIFSMYQTNIMTTALIYVVVGLGLNIVVGLAGLLDLGYVAFYAVGAYSYALLNHHFGLGFWMALPLGAMFAFLFGVVLGFPVLRLRGDYLAIVTLGFGEIIRLVLENWNAFSFGPSGIANIPRPGFFGMDLSLSQSITYVYFVMIGLVIFTVFVVKRLQDSRLGRAWIALREDEVACQAMGIDKTRTKLSAFALGATWAGIGGVVFAAKTTFINPASFTIWESIIILCVVVLGGMGSILGVILGALVLILLPEYLRAFSEYRMLIFGATLVIMMVFRPEGIITDVRKTYKFKGLKNNQPTT
ncbi:MAG: branched-chain amino acid ABC transporter permease [Deltaproteobacteria bacterium]|nr:MAG: branched-chain amino acid ABC transporter permease [Deltaproteobacteria bacterium]RLC16658.1 MAG: branched-chain amino acid ABC transporter permease [Deltaproteobacteria bacterium]